MSQPALLAGLFEALPVPAFLVDADVTVLLANHLGRILASESPEGIASDPRRGGALLHCVHAEDVPEGCGRGPACAACGLRGVVGDALTDGRAAHRACSLTIRRGEEQLLVQARASAAPLLHSGEQLVVLTLGETAPAQARPAAPRRPLEPGP